MPRKKRKSVHLVFRSHSPAERYLPGKLPKNLRTLVVENYLGWPKSKSISFDLFLGVKPESRFDATADEASKEMLLRGRRVIAGESLHLPDRTKYARLHNASVESLTAAVRTPSLANISDFLQCEVAFEDFRERIIAGNIAESKREKQTPLLARYGSSHSRLSKRLRELGIESSRTVLPRVASFYEEVLYKLIEHKPVSELDLKKGFVSRLIGSNIGFVEAVLGKPVKSLREKDAAFVCLVENVLLRRLQEPEVDAILRSKDLGALLVFNGLPRSPTRKTIVDFLGRNSSFWKHQQTIREQRAAKK